MILKVGQCIAAALLIQKQQTLGIAIVTAQQLPVARKLKLLFGYSADARNEIAECLIIKTDLMLYKYCCEFRHHSEPFV